jgi:hypothetical protein
MDLLHDVEMWHRVQTAEEARDAFGDQLAAIAAQLDTNNVESVKIVAQMVLDEKGYLPFGRLREAERTIEALRQKEEAFDDALVVLSCAYGGDVTVGDRPEVTLARLVEAATEAKAILDGLRK